MALKVDAADAAAQTEKVKTQEQEPKKVVVPIVKKEDKKGDLDKLPQGYAVERQTDDDDKQPVDTGKQSADDDTEKESIDTDVNPNQRILKTHTSYAHHASNQYSNSLINQIKETMIEGVEDNNSAGNKLAKAMKELENDNTSIFESIPTDGKVNVTTEVSEEISGYKYIDSENNQIKMSTNVSEGAAILAYGKEYKNNTKFKIVGGVYGSVTNDNTKISIPDDSTEFEISEDIDSEVTETNYGSSEYFNTSFKETTVDVKAFLASQYEFKNNDLATTTFSLSHEGDGDTRIDFKGRYDNKQSKMYIEVSGMNYNNAAETIDKDQTSQNTFMANIKLGYNKNSDKEEPQQVTEQQTTENQKYQFKTNTTKWVRNTHLYSSSDILDDNEIENGIVAEKSFTKTTENSKLRINTFLKSSIIMTPKPEGQAMGCKPSFTYGANLNYKTNTTKGTFDGNIQLREKRTINEANTFTLTGKAAYKTEQVSVGAEAMYINVTEPNNPVSKYLGAGLQFGWRPKKVKGLEISLAGDYVKLIQNDININGGSGQVKVSKTF